jgi:hypothetical protein
MLNDKRGGDMAARRLLDNQIQNELIEFCVTRPIQRRTRQ